jgi:hypothetical protein
MGATAGDLLVRDLTREWLERAGFACDIAIAPPFSGGVDWRAANPADYSHVVFVCGPCGECWPLSEFLAKFAACRLVGLNLSMVERLEDWNPFHVLIERDSNAAGRPDLSILAPERRVPVVGLVLRDASSEYHGRHRYEAVRVVIERFLAAREMAIVRIDTRLDVANGAGLRTPAEIESLIARMDVVLTTRLHGLVFGIRNGVPVVAVDSIAGGAKIRRQAETLGWPVVLTPETLDDQSLAEGFEYCLRQEARAKALECRERGVVLAAQARDEFLAALAQAVEVKG